MNAFLSGGSRGLGLALARALADRGWSVVIDARNEIELRQAVATLPETVEALPGDVTDPSHRKHVAERLGQLGPLDLLVNNASTLGPAPLPPLAAYPLDDLRRVYEVNLVAPLAIIQGLLPIIRRPGGKIINISSDAAVEGYPGWGGYGSAKAALEQISAVLAVENPDLGVYWVDPGDMNTRMQQEAYPGEDVSDRAPPSASIPGLLSLIEGHHPSGRYRARSVIEA